MIVDHDFIWLHFPKCAGTSVEKAIRRVRPEAQFDEMDPQNVIWHENVARRKRRDPTFTIEGKKIICCIRRLPYWILSRVHFEAEQKPGFHTATREMLLTGRFHERDGRINQADTYMHMYANPRVDHWIRTENAAEDLAAALSLPEIRVEKENSTKATYIKKLSFWFTPDELARLYEANPLWAEVETSVYGSLLAIE